MFGHLNFDHLKNEEFVNITEGQSPSIELQAHLDSCMKCKATLETTAVTYQELFALDVDIPEKSTRSQANGNQE